MSVEEVTGFVQCGRRFSRDEIEQICETVELFPALSLRELLATLCEHLGWYTAGGGLKSDACEKLLVKLQEQGLLRLPKKQGHAPNRRKIAISSRTQPQAAIVGSLKELGAVRVQPVEGEDKSLADEYLKRYHPLGYRQPFGYRLRYLIETDRGRVGCLLLCGAAKSLETRDRWIGWTQEQRLQRLAWVVNLSRHLVFPWVGVRNLSSHVLGLLWRRLAGDWERRWGYRPVLVETFVDPRYHSGSSYKAAGWEQVGMTSGEGLVRPGCRYTTTVKRIFVKPLCADFRTLLCSEPAPTRGLQ